MNVKFRLGCGPAGFVVLVIAVMTAMVGHQIHHGIFWSIVDFFLFPFAWIKWLIFHQIKVSVLKATFGFLAN